MLTLLLLFAATSAQADKEAIGTIGFSLDGDEELWYVVESRDGLHDGW